MGISAGKGAAAGAAAGVSIDLLTGGLTLGAAAALGAVIGGTWNSLSRFGDRLLGKLTGVRELSVDDAIVRALAARQQALLRALTGRGHAALTPIELNAEAVRRWREDPFPETLERSRSHPEWCGMSGMPKDDSSDRAATILTLARSIADA